MDTTRFDCFARSLATPGDRRAALRLIAGGLVAGLLPWREQPARAAQLADSDPIACLASMTNCGGVCVLTQYDDQHCGACGNGCLFWEMCREGVCVANPLNERG